MSIIKQISESDDKASFIKNIESLSHECIPILIQLILDSDEQTSNAASQALISICRDTEFSETVNVIRPYLQDKNHSNNKSNEVKETRIPCSKPKHFSDVTIHIIEYSIHIFTIFADKYPEITRNDALPVFQHLYNCKNFLVTKQIMLDTCNFLLLFLPKSDELRQQAYNLLYQIQEISQNHCDVEVAIAIQSLLCIFPEEGVHIDIK